MTWLNITEEKQLYDSLDIDIVRTYNESPNGYSRNLANWTFLSTYIDVNQRKNNTASPEITTGTVNIYAFVKFTSPIARQLGKSEIKTICGNGDWLIINESATSDVPLIDLNSFDFAQYFYYVTISFAWIADVVFANGMPMGSTPLSITYLDLSRKVMWQSGGIESSKIGYFTSKNSTNGVCNFVSASTNFTTSTNTADADSEMTFSFNLEYLLQSNNYVPNARYIGFLFDTTRIPLSVSSYRWIIDKVQFEIKRIKK